jgi:hypothetical protein
LSATTYYSYGYRLNGVDAYLLWYTDLSEDGNEPDGVLLDDAGPLLTFRSLANLNDYAARCGLAVKPDGAMRLDLDVVQHWLAHPRKTTVDCEIFLNAWNLFSDLATAIQGSLAYIDAQKEIRIYDKLFWGNNIPAITPPGKHYDPVWTKSEIGRMQNVLKDGMQLFRGRLLEPTFLPVGTHSP